jgi:hypothetical protein
LPAPVDNEVTVQRVLLAASLKTTAPVAVFGETVVARFTTLPKVVAVGAAVTVVVVVAVTVKLRTEP